MKSKNKGNRFELKIAKLLSDALGVKFHRVPCSGGLHWAGDNRITGDIVPPADYDWPYSIECKNRNAALDVHALISGTSPLFDWYRQAEEDASRSSGIGCPVVVFNIQRRGIYCAMMEEDVPISGGPKIVVPYQRWQRPERLWIMSFFDWLEAVAEEQKNESSVVDK